MYENIDGAVPHHWVSYAVGLNTIEKTPILALQAANIRPVRMLCLEIALLRFLLISCDVSLVVFFPNFPLAITCKTFSVGFPVLKSDSVF